MQVEIPILATAHFELRPWATESAAAFISRQPESANTKRFRSDMRNAHWDALGYGSLAVFENESGRLAGAAGVDLGGWPDEPNGWWQVPEITGALFPEFQKRGYGEELAVRGLHWAFMERVPALERLIAVTLPGNTRSEAVMRKIGMHKTKETRDARTDAPANEVVVYEIERIDYVQTNGFS